MNTLRLLPRGMVKAVAAGAVLVAAALPLAAATAASAGTPALQFKVSATYTANSFGTGASGTFTLTDATGPFAADGGNISMTTTAPGVTFSNLTEAAGGTTVTGSFASTSATVAGSYTATVTDDNGTSAAYPFSVNQGPTLSSTTPVSPASLSQGNGATDILVNGANFTDNTTLPIVAFTSTVNGTTLLVNSVAFVSSTQLKVNVTPENSVLKTVGSGTPGTYTVSVTNEDGGTITSGPIFTVTAYGITNVSPSAVASAATATTATVTVSGAGFEYGAKPTLTCANAALVSPTTTLGTVTGTVTSATSMTLTFTYTNSAVDLCDLTITNPDTAHGGNGATATLAGALGIGEASNVGPTITATSDTTAIVPGSAASSVTFTGSGFSNFTLAYAYTDSKAASQDLAVTLTGCASSNGTTLTCTLNVANGAFAGPHWVKAVNGSGSSNIFAAGVLVAGPAIASQSPAGIAVGAPVGTVVKLIGTGFTNTTSATYTPANATGLNGIVSYVSPTEMDFVVTHSPIDADVTTSASTTPNIVLSQTVANNVAVSSAPFVLTVDAAPYVTKAVTYKVGTGVGVGATAQTIYIHGTGFAAGATVTTFVNGAGTADPNVTATVTAVSSDGTQITATVAVAAGDTNFADGYTVTNTDGGVAKVPAVAYPLLINAGPTITAVTPSPATPAATNAFTITGTGFATGVVVTPTSDGTCGPTTLVSSTSITVSCTLGAEGTSAVSLVVTNLDGGSATSAAVMPAATPVPPKPPVTFHVIKAYGYAVVGRTVHILVVGTGFFGQPRISSNAHGVVARVAHDTGRSLYIVITVKAGSAKGWHVLTVWLANGKHGSTRYLTK